MGSRALVVRDVGSQHSAQMSLIEADDGVLCENLADGLRGLAVIELENATEPLTAPYLARSQ
jgi:hypothetical protein